jgi:hypothetical protein
MISLLREKDGEVEESRRIGETFNLFRDSLDVVEEKDFMRNFKEFSRRIRILKKKWKLGTFKGQAVFETDLK